MSPALSPVAPVSVTVWVVLCSVTFNSCGSAATGPAAMRPAAAAIGTMLSRRKDDSSFRDFGMTTSLSRN